MNPRAASSSGRRGRPNPRTLCLHIVTLGPVESDAPRRSSQSTQVAPFGVADLAVKPILDASKTESITRLMVSPKRLVVICQVSVPARQSGSGSCTTLPRGFSWLADCNAVLQVAYEPAAPVLWVASVEVVAARTTAATMSPVASI